MNNECIAKYIYWLQRNVFELNCAVVWKNFDLSTFVFSIYSDSQKLTKQLPNLTYEIALQQYIILEQRYFYAFTLL